MCLTSGDWGRWLSLCGARIALPSPHFKFGILLDWEQKLANIIVT